MAEWRNWQTHRTQNPALFTEREGSTPSSATNPQKTASIAPLLRMQADLSLPAISQLNRL